LLALSACTGSGPAPSTVALTFGRCDQQPRPPNSTGAPAGCPRPSVPTAAGDELFREEMQKCVEAALGRDVTLIGDGPVPPATYWVDATVLEPGAQAYQDGMITFTLALRRGVTATALAGGLYQAPAGGMAPLFAYHRICRDFAARARAKLVPNAG
jgi:hypothetical protein